MGPGYEKRVMSLVLNVMSVVKLPAFPECLLCSRHTVSRRPSHVCRNSVNAHLSASHTCKWSLQGQPIRCWFRYKWDCVCDIWFSKPNDSSGNCVSLCGNPEKCQTTTPPWWNWLSGCGWTSASLPVQQSRSESLDTRLESITACVCLWPCRSYFSVAVLKCQALKSFLTEEFVLAYGPRGRVQNVREGMEQQEAEKVNRNPQSPPQWQTSSRKA